MYPESNIPVNPMGLSAQSSANMMGSMGNAVNSALPSEELQANPQEITLQKIAGQFKNAWMVLEDLNGSNGGDADKFRALQKAAEDWFASLQLPESTTQNSGY